MGRLPQIKTREEDPLAELRTRLMQNLVDQQLIEMGMLIVDEHIDFGNGYCGRSYLHTAPLLRYPGKVMSYANQLIDQLGNAVIRTVDVVAGSVTGGQLFAFAVAASLEGRGTFGANSEVAFAPIYKDRTTGKVHMRSYFRDLIADKASLKPRPKNVLVIDDVCLTGRTLRSCVDYITGPQVGGNVVAVRAIFDRGQMVEKIENYDFLERSELDADLVPTSECPYHRHNIQVYEF